jgi:NAD(P)H-quinone oxidoreductase subunit 5
MHTLLPLIAPLALIAAAIVAFTGPAFRPLRTARLAEGAALAALAVAVLSAVTLIAYGPGTSPALGGANGLSLRLDVLSMVMLVLVSAVGWVVLRYSATYMDGEARQGPFTGWICLTLAAVMLLVTAGSLVLLLAAWIATSLFLHQLLLFYPDRVQAQRAARKKALMARLGDVALIGAVLVMINGYGTGDIATILAAASNGIAPAGTIWAAALLAVAALLKSAQFPSHGWLTEVMETPTPVSALLHAGVINAGGFLLIRFADVMLLAPAVLAVLVMIGGFTALFGGLVMLTQTAVKTSLAWSTVAQMGFMILQCGRDRGRRQAPRPGGHARRRRGAEGLRHFAGDLCGGQRGLRPR